MEAASRVFTRPGIGRRAKTMMWLPPVATTVGVEAGAEKGRKRKLSLIRYFRCRYAKFD